MRPMTIESCRIAEIGFENGVLVQCSKVVSLEVTLNRNFPIGPGHHAGGEQVTFSEFQTFQNGSEVAEPRVNVNLKTGSEAYKNHTVLFNTG